MCLKLFGTIGIQKFKNTIFQEVCLKISIGGILINSLLKEKIVVKSTVNNPINIYIYIICIMSILL